jgi:nucleoid-associated protein YgaU
MQTAPTQLSVRLSVLLTTVCIAFLLIGGAAGAEAPPPPTTDYVVRAGDTLWAIASEHSGSNRDVRVAIAEIVELSGVDGTSLHPGQVLRIPRG